MKDRTGSGSVQPGLAHFCLLTECVFIQHGLYRGQAGGDIVRIDPAHVSNANDRIGNVGLTTGDGHAIFVIEALGDGLAESPDGSCTAVTVFDSNPGSASSSSPIASIPARVCSPSAA